MQRAEMVVESAEQATALQDVGFLGQFVEPASPSEVARKLGLAPNLAHHHAKRHASLGLLVEVRRESGRVYYQLAARRFKHRRSLVPVGHRDERVTATLSRLEARFLEAYERADRIVGAQDPDWTVYGFVREREREPEAVVVGDLVAPEARPAHLQVRTVRLTPEGYVRLVREVWRLLEEAQSDTQDAGAACTLAFIAMDGVLHQGEQEGMTTASFVPPPVLEE